MQLSLHTSPHTSNSSGDFVIAQSFQFEQGDLPQERIVCGIEILQKLAELVSELRGEFRAGFA
ncbi:MAG UNVERIFIED_CONTAM: hypothetical protein LVR18_33370 [Planctomycetaceae bacterium]|jgi:hypothetical protein